MGCHASKATKAPSSQDVLSLQVCGKIGAVINYASGHIDEVLADSQAKRLGVQKGWQVIQVDDMPYSRQLLEEKVATGTPFQLTFSRASAQQPPATTLLQEPVVASNALKKELEEIEEVEGSATEVKQETQETAAKTEENAEGVPAGSAAMTKEEDAVEKKEGAEGCASTAIAVTEVAAKTEESQGAVGSADKAADGMGETAALKAVDPAANERIIEEMVPEAEAVQAKAPWKCICAGFA